MSSSLQERPGAGPRPGPGVPVLPSSEDPVVAGLAEAVGGRPGLHARLTDRRFLSPVRWLVLITLFTSLLGFWQKAPCRVHPWADEYQYTRACYTDVFALYFSERLNEGKAPYLEHPVEYPVVIGAVMKVAADAVEVFPADQRPRRFYDLTWMLLTACAVVVTVTTVRLTGRRRVWDAAMFAAAPALVLHGTTNWDLVATALAGVAMVLWARRQPLWAGVALGAATATKLYPVLFLVPLLALAYRTRTLRSWLVAAVAAAVTGALLVVPVYLISPSFADIGGVQTKVAESPLDRYDAEGLRALAPHLQTTAPDGSSVEGINAVYRFVELNNTRGADWDSLYFAVSKLRTPGDSLRNDVLDLVLDSDQGPGQPPHVLNRAVEVSFLLCLALVVLLALRAPRRPRFPQLLFLVLVAFFLTNKVFSPQYVIWLVPIAVLARPRWRPFLAWQAAEAVVLFTRFYFFIGNDKPGQGLGYDWFLGAVLLRDALLLVLAAYVVRDVLRPQHDVVRTDPLSGLPTGEDDPAGGVLDGAPDARGPRTRAEREPVAV
ncbi:MAG: putative transrane protein [Frankiales bacterium]|nr:putative transrane protein [Frankiales bacterium]